MAPKGTSQVPSLLQQLQSDEAVLMMYVAGELPADDRAEVDRRLASDPRLRAELERLRDAHDAFAVAMAALDRSTRLPVPEAAALRRAGGLFRHWQAERSAQPPATAPASPQLRYPWWAYPASAAAAIVVAFLVWWGNADRRDEDRYVVPNLPLRFDTGDRPSTPDFLAAMILATSSPIDGPDDFGNLVAPTDYAILAPLLYETDAGGADEPGQADPAEPGREQDDSDLPL